MEQARGLKHVCEALREQINIPMDLALCFEIVTYPPFFISLFKFHVPVKQGEFIKLGFC